MKAFRIAGACALIGACAAGGCSGGGGAANGGTGGGGATSGGGMGGAGGGSGASGDDRLFVPALPNTLIDGQVSTLTLIAFTLVPGAAGLQFYAAVRNDGPRPVCDPGIMIYFIDKAGQEVTSAAAGFRTGRFYRLPPDTVLACVDPGKIAMGASTNVPAEVVLDQLGSLQHSFVFFDLSGLVPIDGLAVSALETVATAAGRAYRGTVMNGLPVTVSSLSVTVFPVNRVGRPLGMTTSSATMDLAPGGAWPFETGAVTDPGVDQIAYPAAAIPVPN